MSARFDKIAKLPYPTFQARSGREAHLDNNAPPNFSIMIRQFLTPVVCPFERNIAHAFERIEEQEAC
jgi:hypothetical protein